MKVKDMIEKLQKEDPEMEVMIQQGGEFDYMIAHSVSEKELVDMNANEDEEEITAIVIEFI